MSEPGAVATGSTFNVAYMIRSLPLAVLTLIRFATAPGSETPSLTVGLPPRSNIEGSTIALFSRKESANVQANRSAGVDGRERR